MSYMQDPNMEAARLKILAVLKEHDLMGLVLVASQERAGFFQEVSPSWSCARAEESPDGQVAVRIKSNREDYASAEEQEKQVTLTVSGFVGLLHVHQRIGQSLSALLAMLSRTLDIRSVIADERIQTAECKPDEGQNGARS